jgi:serine/threonine protein kinase
VLARRIGTFEPLLMLASGGMASVYVARQRSVAGIERLVVLKRVHPHLVSNREFCHMFLDEGRISSQIRHANVVSVIDAAEIGGEVCLIQEYVESVSMRQLIEAAKAAGEWLPPAVTAHIVCDMLKGLHAAHGAVDLRGQPLHVVHRDVSPGNIVVGLDGVSRLIDFGIARAATRLVETDSGVIKGKFAYMAPEQLKHRPVDARTDIFAAAAVLFHGLTGVAPFGSSNEGDTVLRILLTEVPDPSSFHSAVPKALDAVVQRALERDPDDRFESAAAFREAIERACPPASTQEVAAVVERFASEVLHERRQAIQEVLDKSSFEESRAVPLEDTRPASRPTRAYRSAVAVLAVAGLAGLAFLGLRHLAAAPSSTALASPPAASTSAEVPVASAVTPLLAPSALPAPNDTGTVTSSSDRAPTPPRPTSPAQKTSGRPSELHRKNPYAQ